MGFLRAGEGLEPSTLSLGKRRDPPTPFHAVPLRRTDARNHALVVPPSFVTFQGVRVCPGRWVVDGLVRNRPRLGVMARAHPTQTEELPVELFHSLVELFHQPILHGQHKLEFHRDGLSCVRAGQRRYSI